MTTAGSGRYATANPLGSVARRVLRVGDDKCDRVANMAHPVARQGAPRRHDYRRHGRDLGDAWQTPDADGIEIGGSEDAVYSGVCRAAAASIASISA